MSRPNNFDLIRHAAALSVFAQHLTGFGVVHVTAFLTFAAFFPGVPVFFIISGYLITSSFLQNPDLGRYLRARFLRIYPAFFVSTLVLSLILFAGDYFNFSWFINQFTVVGVYGVPQVTVPFAGGMPNPNLWTIPIEVRFYLLVPLIFKAMWWCSPTNQQPRNRVAAIVVVLMLASLVLQLSEDFGLHHHPDLRHGITHHFLFFGAGMLARLYIHQVGRFLSVPFWLTAHILLTAVLLHFTPATTQLGGLALGENTPLTLLLVLTLPGVILSLAFNTRPVKWLGDIDLSYSIYLYQAPIMFAVKHIGLYGPMAAVIDVTLTLGAAALSWGLVEAPALRLKR